MTKMSSRRRVLAAVTDTPQTANAIFERTGIHDVRLVLQELKVAKKVECVRCKMSQHPYFTTNMWYLADTKDVKIPQYRSEILEAVFKAVTHEPKVQKEIVRDSGVKQPLHSLKTLVASGRIKLTSKTKHYKRKSLQFNAWMLPEE